jgi:uncharacterized membrane protein
MIDRRKAGSARRSATTARAKATTRNGTTARHRNKDPQTSREAAEFVRDHLPHLENRVFRAIRRSKNRGMIYDELVDELGIDKVTVSPRTRPLAEKGLIYASNERRMGKSGRFQTVWKCIEWKAERSKTAA